MTAFRAHVVAVGAVLRHAVLGLVLEAGVDLAHTPAPGDVVVAAGRTAEDALDLCPEPAGTGLLLLADHLTRDGVLRAVREGFGAILRRADASPARLRAALHSAHHGDGRLPTDALLGLFRPAAPAPGPVAASPLTDRQTAVLRLMAEGRANSAIARSLSCSEHTVKNTIYELMGRLQAHNRCHAVATAIRTGLI